MARENRGTIEQVERGAVAAAERLGEVDGGRERAFGSRRGQSERLPLALDVEHGADSGGLQGKEAPLGVGGRRRREKPAGSEVQQNGPADA